MAGFPSALEPVYIGQGLWLRVKVLTLPDALKGADSVRVAVGIAAAAAEPDTRDGDERPQPDSARLAARINSARSMTGVARSAVIGHAWSNFSESAEAEWRAQIAHVNDEAARRYTALRDEHAAAMAGVTDPSAIAAASDALGMKIAAVDEWLMEESGKHRLEPGTPPSQWLPLTIVPNPQDEDRDRNMICAASIDQISQAWMYHVADVALRAVLESRSEVRPLSKSGL